MLRHFSPFDVLLFTTTMLPYLLWFNFTLFEFAALSLASAYGTKDPGQNEEEAQETPSVNAQMESSTNSLQTLTEELNETKETSSSPYNLVQKTVNFLLRQTAPSTAMPPQQQQ